MHETIVKKLESVSRNISYVVLSTVISYHKCGDKCDINVLTHEIEACAILFA